MENPVNIRETILTEWRRKYLVLKTQTMIMVFRIKNTSTRLRVYGAVQIILTILALFLIGLLVKIFLF
jgi:hypothetical protein